MPRLKFNPRLVRISLLTTGPRYINKCDQGVEQERQGNKFTVGSCLYTLCPWALLYKCNLHQRRLVLLACCNTNEVVDGLCYNYLLNRGTA